MALSEREKEMVAIGASIGVNCIPCLQWHHKKCQDLGFTQEEMQEAFDMAKTVKETANGKVYEAVGSLGKTCDCGGKCC